MTKEDQILQEVEALKNKYDALPQTDENKELFNDEFNQILIKYAKTNDQL